ncbi:thymidylate kinase-domain-containing protein [Hypoxylon sp. FL1150]|nr:thymidylate kinase-domain-containing protein [Hypoxylon sp. FL1150]
MASINDLATAATIASSAVALQSSPTQKTASASPPHSPSQGPTTAPATLDSTITSLPAAAVSQSQSQSQPTIASGPNTNATTTMANEEGDSITVATGHPPPPVLAAPRIEPQSAAAAPAAATAAQIPTPQAPAPAAAAEEAAAGGAADDKTAVASGSSTNAGPSGATEDTAMDGVIESQEPPVRGAFVVFEGMDRAGKTTQAKLLQQRCIESGRDVRFMRFPDRTTPIGQMIDSYLKGETEIEDHVIHLLFSANRWEAVKKIQAELDAGHTIICDRFYHSGIVYSAAKNIKSLSLSWAKAPEAGLPRPDMVLFLDLEEEVARERGGWGGEVYEKGEMQRRVRDLFWGLSMGDLGSAAAAAAISSSGNGKAPRRDVERLGNGAIRGGGDAATAEEGEFRQEEEDIQIVDADLGVEELSEKVWELVLPRLEAVERGEVGRTVRTVR